MTLEELLKDKKLPVKVRLQDWDKDEYFEIISSNDKGTIGYLKNGNPSLFMFNCINSWEPYQELRKKTVLSEYIIKSFSNGFTSYYFKSDEDFLTQFNGPIIKTGRTIEVELP